MYPYSPFHLCDHTWPYHFDPALKTSFDPITEVSNLLFLKLLQETALSFSPDSTLPRSRNFKILPSRGYTLHSPSCFHASTPVRRNAIAPTSYRALTLPYVCTPPTPGPFNAALSRIHASAILCLRHSNAQCLNDFSPPSYSLSAYQCHRVATSFPTRVPHDFTISQENASTCPCIHFFYSHAAATLRLCASAHPRSPLCLQKIF